MTPWGPVARAVLKRERRPVLLLDNEGVVRFANQGIVSLLGWAQGEIIGRALCDVCVQPHRREQTTVQLKKALEGSAATSTGLRCITRAGETLTLVSELTSIACHPSRYLLIIILAVEQDLPASPRLIGQEMYYEITSHPSADFGMIRHAWGQVGAAAARPGDRCFRALHKRDSPCPDCPVGQISDQMREAVAILSRPDPSTTLDVVRVSAIDKDSVAVSIFPVTEGLFGQLLQKKVETLALRGGLSERERSVLDLLLLGRTMDNIASVLKISSRTVKYHQRNIQQKLGAESRADLVRLLL